MKTYPLALMAAVLACAALIAADPPKSPPPSASESEIIAKARADYPLKTCLVSNEAIDADAVSYVHREAGKPDRVLFLCCEGCIDDFKGDPAKFLAKLDAAAKAKSPSKKKSTGKS